MHNIDLLAFGPHPDDVELGMGGTLARHNAQGRTTAIFDLTRGEMGSNGTPAERVAEGEAAAKILGCAWRRNLALPDRGLDHRDPEQMLRVVNAIRMVRPQVVAINWSIDRHPDHGAASRLLEEALFTAGLRRYETEYAAYRPAKVVYYFINDEAEPSFLVDITETHPKKYESVFAHRSQFKVSEGDVETRLNRATGLPYLVDSRDRHFGAKAGVQYAEGFVVKAPRLVADLISD
jgi:bacillithiol biosynthesis deacetylase BshB1